MKTTRVGETDSGMVATQLRRCRRRRLALYRLLIGRRVHLPVYLRYLSVNSELRSRLCASTSDPDRPRPEGGVGAARLGDLF